MRVGDVGGEDDTIQRWKSLAERETDLRKRRDYGGLVIVFAEVSKCQDVWKEALKEWNMVRSQVVDEWRAELMVDVVLDTLKLRFGSIPEELTNRIRLMNDLDHLRTLHNEAVKAPTLQAWVSGLPTT